MSNTTAKKRCLRCEKLLPLDAFSQSKKHRDGHLNTCKVCNSKLNRERYKAKVLETEPPKMNPIKKHKPDGEKNHSLRKGVTCAFHCAKFPCFEGMSNMSCNLALTCHNFKSRSA